MPWIQSLHNPQHAQQRHVDKHFIAHTQGRVSEGKKVWGGGGAAALTLLQVADAPQRLLSAPPY